MPVLTTIEHGVKIPVKIWSKDVESSAMDQLKNVARLPFVFHHIAAMPDVHWGNGATVGSVIATKNAVVPAAVGVDIGCGMMAVKTDCDLNKTMDLAAEIRNQIERSVPVGFNANSTIRKEVENWKGWQEWDGMSDKSDGLKEKAMSQLGTLGGGNHFIEICGDTDSNVWVMLHSGSRGTGNKMARRHIDDAKKEMRALAEGPPDPELAHFVKGTPSYEAYMMDLWWLQDYAYFNRVEMMRRVLDQLTRLSLTKTNPAKRLIEVNCHHNYSAEEEHFGEKVLITRKGAVSARKGEWGIIPGSMGTNSYIVTGKGNADSFHSCSHGAGRRMSRSQAKRQFTEEDLAIQTDGVECRKDRGVLDEIPGSYKDIETVMANQDDLVKIEAVLKQFVCVKG